MPSFIRKGAEYVFKNSYGEIRSGWALLLAMAFSFLAQFAVGIIIGIVYHIQNGVTPQALDAQNIAKLANAPLTLIILYVLTIGSLFFLFRMLYKRPVRQLGYCTTEAVPQFALGGLFGIVAFTLAIALLLIAGQVQLTDFNAAVFTQGSFWMGLVFYVLVGINEEHLCRGL